MISEERENQKDDRDSTINALNKVIFEVNHLKNTIQKFVKATEYEFRSESSSSNIRKNSANHKASELCEHVQRNVRFISLNEERLFSENTTDQRQHL